MGRTRQLPVLLCRLSGAAACSNGLSHFASVCALYEQFHGCQRYPEHALRASALLYVLFLLIRRGLTGRKMGMEIWPRATCCSAAPAYCSCSVLRHLADELGSMAAQDPLAKLLNRRGLLIGLEAHFAAAKAAPVHLLIVDIDRCKRINDSDVQQLGDIVLCHVSHVIVQCTRKGDTSSGRGGVRDSLSGTAGG